MRSVMNRAIIIYIVYGLLIYWYLFHSSVGVPEIYIGTHADPATFMNAREIQLSTQYSRLKDLLYFLATPFEWLVVLFFIVSRKSTEVEKWLKANISIKWIQVTMYYVFFSIFVFICTIPFQLVSFLISRSYNVSVQSLPAFIREELLDFGINLFMMILFVQVFLYLLKRWKNKWWIIGWLLTIPFTFFLSFIQPVVLEPLYNDFSPISDKALETKILAMADEAGVPVSNVYEVKMSDETNALNAYVNGIGSNTRIVLWDTTLERLTDEEILFIMAHEISHYVHHHIYWGIAFGLLLSFVGFHIFHLILKRMKLTPNSFSVIPVTLLTVSLLTFLASPITNIFSRYEERVSDEYALQLTGDRESGIKTFQSLSKASLNEVNPPQLVKIFLYSHPTIFERIIYLEEK